MSPVGFSIAALAEAIELSLDEPAPRPSGRMRASAADPIADNLADPLKSMGMLRTEMDGGYGGLAKSNKVHDHDTKLAKTE